MLAAFVLAKSRRQYLPTNIEPVACNVARNSPNKEIEILRERQKSAMVECTSARFTVDSKSRRPRRSHRCRTVCRWMRLCKATSKAVCANHGFHNHSFIIISMPKNSTKNVSFVQKRFVHCFHIKINVTILIYGLIPINIVHIISSILF